MIAKVLTRVNALIGIVLGLFGLTCVSCVEYGCPHADFEASGMISDQESQPIENIRVQLKLGRNRVPFSRAFYSGGNGQYQLVVDDIIVTDSVYIVATDTTGVYASDSVCVPVVYSTKGIKKKDRWYEGKATITQDFQLKKQD